MTSLLAHEDTGLPPEVTDASRGRWQRTSSSLAGRLTVLVLVLLLAWLVLLPLFELQRRALADGAAGYRTALSGDELVRVLLTTGGLALGSLAIAVPVGTALAWFTDRLPRGCRWMSVLPVLPILLPAVAGVVGWSFLFAPRIGYANQILRLLPWWSHLDSGPVNIYSLPWIIVVTGISLVSFVYVFVSGGMRNINSELVEAARTAGSTSFGVFWKIVLPLLRPSLVYASAVCLVLGLGQFTAPLLLGRTDGVDVLTTLMFGYVSTTPIDFGAAAAVGSPLLIVGLAIVVWQRWVLGDQSRFVTHQGKSFRANGSTSALGAVCVAVYGLLAAVVPILALVLVALSPAWQQNIPWHLLSLQHFKDTLAQPAVLDAVGSSLGYSAIAIAVTLPLTYLIAVLIVRGRRYRVLRAAADVLVAVPLGIPAAIFGAGFLFLYAGPPFYFYGTPIVLILVYVTLMLPFGTRLLLAGLFAVGDQYVDASRACGGGAFRTHLRILIPLLRGSIGSAAGVMFILLSHEFAASLLVRSPKTNVMGTLLYDAFENGSFSDVAVISLLMTVVTGAGLLLCLLVDGRSALSRL